MRSFAELARWAFEKPRRLVALAALPLAVWATLNLTSRDDSNPPSGGVAPSATAEAATDRDPAAASDPRTPAARTAVLPVEVDRVVRDFLDAWLSHTDTADAWFAAIAPHVTPQLADGLRSTDPARVPDATVADVSPTDVGDYVAVVTARLSDGSAVAVEAVFDGDRWLVAELDAAP